TLTRAAAVTLLGFFTWTGAVGSGRPRGSLFIVGGGTQSLMTVSGYSADATHGNLGAVHAIRSRVHLFQQNGAGAEAELLSGEGCGWRPSRNRANHGLHPAVRPGLYRHAGVVRYRR